MKKALILLFVFCAAAGPLQSQFTKVGAGLVYGSGFYFDQHEHSYYHTGNPALKIQGIYEVNLPVHFSPSLTVFMPRVEKTELDTKYVTSTFQVEVDGHYVFNYLDRFELYGLAGLNVTFAKNKFTTEYMEDPEVNRDNALGLNAGIGSYMKFSEQLDFYGEVKYIFSKYDQVMVTVGVLLNLQWLKENEEPLF